MRPALALSLFGLSILCSGCALVEDASRNLLVGVTKPIEEHKEIARNRRWADGAWQKTCAESGPRQFSDDYAQGFKDGYAEHLFRGGDGEPPLLAPLRYRHLRYQTPQGYVAVEDWFAGYRQGSLVAHDTGARRWITGPTGLLMDPHGLTVHEPHHPAEGEPLPAPAHGPKEQPQPSPLPMPQPLPKMTFEQPRPKGAGIELEPPTFPVEMIEPVRARIMGIRVPPWAAPEPSMPAPPQPQPKVMIQGISVAPLMAPEASVEPVRIRIRMVTPVTPKD